MTCLPYHARKLDVRPASCCHITAGMGATSTAWQCKTKRPAQGGEVHVLWGGGTWGHGHERASMPASAGASVQLKAGLRLWLRQGSELKGPSEMAFLCWGFALTVCSHLSATCKQSSVKAGPYQRARGCRSASRTAARLRQSTRWAHGLVLKSATLERHQSNPQHRSRQRRCYLQSSMLRSSCLASHVCKAGMPSRPACTPCQQLQQLSGTSSRLHPHSLTRFRALYTAP